MKYACKGGVASSNVHELEYAGYDRECVCVQIASADSECMVDLGKCVNGSSKINLPLFIFLKGASSETRLVHFKPKYDLVRVY